LDLTPFMSFLSVAALRHLPPALQPLQLPKRLSYHTGRQRARAHTATRANAPANLSLLRYYSLPRAPHLLAEPPTTPTSDALIIGCIPTCMFPCVVARVSAHVLVLHRTGHLRQAT
jgi:hypothetical protein